ncbi:MAG TPA: ACP phosphodiesterase [Flavitalea sp.]|nr:ACP phosphodiesterase [Flavitalea sp.]
MNLLAHAYLSFNDPGILTGNMISDFVKGKKKFDYSLRVQQGIALHRHIDAYTDAHASVKVAKEVFRPVYRLYSGALVDIVFDHFLAIDESEFQGNLQAFSNRTYQQLEEFEPSFPEPFRQMFPYMKAHDWLYNYRSAAGIERSFAGLVHRSKYLTESNSAIRIFHQQYDQLKTAYTSFFPALKKYAYEIFIDL